MTDASGQRQRAEAVVDTVKAELPPIWLGGRQRMVLVDEITQALTTARQEALKEAVSIVEDWPLGIEDRLGLLDRLAREGRSDARH